MLTEVEIVELEDARIAAMLAADVEAMDILYDDSLKWVHASGRVDGKSDTIRQFAEGVMRCHAMSRPELTIRLFGDTAVTNGIIDMDGQVGDVRKRVQSRFTGVWVARGGSAQLVNWQTTRLG